MCPQKLCFARALQQPVKMAFANIFPKASSSAEVDLPCKICLYESNSSTAASMERFSSHHKAAWHVGLISAHIWAHQKKQHQCMHTLTHTHTIEAERMQNAWRVTSMMASFIRFSGSPPQYITFSLVQVHRFMDTASGQYSPQCTWKRLTPPTPPLEACISHPTK